MKDPIAHVDHLIDDINASRCDMFRCETDAVLAMDRWTNRLHELRADLLQRFDTWAGLPERYADMDAEALAPQ